MMQPPTTEQGQEQEIAHDKYREAAFAALVERVQACRACPRMEGRLRVLGPNNGNLHSSVLFVAEAPGRLGGDLYNIPLYGDMSGRNFHVLLQAAGLERGEVFITNAVLCNPRNTSGNNCPPNAEEKRNCAAHLMSTLKVVQPRYVVSLGAVALSALGGIERHNLTLRSHVGQATPWWGRTIVPLYHPGPRALISRSLTVQKEDYRRLGALVGSL